MKLTRIGEIDFETKKTKYFDEYLSRHNGYWTYDNINDAYSRPSLEKIRIFNNWLFWADTYDDCVRDMRIISANSFAFTIGALYVDPETNRVLGYINITRDHNRLMLKK